MKEIPKFGYNETSGRNWIFSNKYLYKGLRKLQKVSFAAVNHLDFGEDKHELLNFKATYFHEFKNPTHFFLFLFFFVFKSPELVFFFGKYVQIYYSNPKLIVKKTLIQRDKQFQENYDFCANYCQEDPKVSKLSRSFFSLVPMVPFYRFYLSTQLTLPSKSLTLSSKSTIETVEKGVKYVQSLQ